MDGLEASAKIHELNTGIPIVAMTANIMTNDRDLYRKSGMSDCVGKPFTSQELWRCLLKYFQPINWQRENETRQIQAENELRQKLITNFVKDNRNKFPEITDALDYGDIKLAHRLVHTLKGNAGQLGKTVLQKTAEQIELQLRDILSAAPENQKIPGGRSLVAAEYLKALEAELKAVLAEFSLLGSEPAQIGDISQVVKFDAESARSLFARLETMLEMGNPECRELVGTLRLVPGFSGDPRGTELLIEDMIQQMNDLDFEPALVSLAELKKKMEMI